MTIIINKRATSFALLSFVVFLHPLHGCAVDTNQTFPRPPAVIVFGDSVVDPGNNNAILTIVRCNYPPYGKDFLGHRATGRFSNGKIPSDLIASQLGIKEYVPAYLGTDLSAYDLITGVSFASGGCGFDPLTSQLVEELKEYAIQPESRIRYIDMYTPLLDMILHPSKYGFVESKRGCCGTGTFEVTQTCNSLTTFVCEDASKYVFWDSYHPTERGYKILMGQLTQRYGASIN